jgi:hypothetical protein
MELASEHSHMAMTNGILMDWFKTRVHMDYPMWLLSETHIDVLMIT